MFFTALGRPAEQWVGLLCLFLQAWCLLPSFIQVEPHMAVTFSFLSTCPPVFYCQEATPLVSYLLLHNISEDPCLLVPSQKIPFTLTYLSTSISLLLISSCFAPQFQVLALVTLLSCSRASKLQLLVSPFFCNFLFNTLHQTNQNRLKLLNQIMFFYQWTAEKITQNKSLAC